MSRRTNSSPLHKWCNKWQTLSVRPMSSYKNLQISSVRLWPWLDTLEFGIGVTSKTSKHYIGNRHCYSRIIVSFMYYQSERVRVLSRAIISQTRVKHHRSVLLKITALGCCAACSDPGRGGRGWKVWNYQSWCWGDKKKKEWAISHNNSNLKSCHNFNAIGLAVLWAGATCT